MSKIKNVLLYSSGLDSYLSLKSNKVKFDDVLFINTGLRYNVFELSKAESLFENEDISTILNVINFRDLGDNEDKVTHFLPFRNIIYLFTSLSKFWKDDFDVLKVYVGGMKDDRVNDNNKEVYDKLTEFVNSYLLKDDSRKIEFGSVYNWEISKVNAIKEYLKNGNSIVDLLLNTYSCYEPVIESLISDIDYNISYATSECFRCKACFRKNVAIYNGSGVFINFYNKDIVKEYMDDLSLPDWRKEEIKNYVDKLSNRIKLLD